MHHIRRRKFLLAVVAFLSAPHAAEAQQTTKVFRIAIFMTVPPTDAAASALQEALLQGLRDLGYVEGKNIVIERRYSEGKSERLPAIAAELVRLKLDVIVAPAVQPPEAAKRATSTIPIVITNHSDPVGTGLVASLARPGGNVTGICTVVPELVGKHLQLLKETVPRISHVAALSNPSNPAHAPYLRAAEVAARTLEIRLHILRASAPSDFVAAFSAMTTQSDGALVMLGDPMFYGQRAHVAELAAKYRLPAIGPWREFVEAGGLIAYGANLADLFRRAATYVDKVLRGAKPADLPVEQPTKFELVVNLKTAKALGLTIPQSILLRADRVIE
jgi:putative ABC transport system substrate-binding protein